MEIQLSVQSSREKFVAPILQKYTKTDIKVFWSSLTLLELSIFLKIFITRLFREANANL